MLTTLILPEGEKRTLERYTLSRVHGEGGLGRVWLARDTDLNRNVALEEIRVQMPAGKTGGVPTPDSGVSTPGGALPPLPQPGGTAVASVKPSAPRKDT